MPGVLNHYSQDLNETTQLNFVHLNANLPVGLRSLCEYLTEPGKSVAEHGKKGLEGLVSPARSGRIFILLLQGPRLGGCVFRPV